MAWIYILKLIYALGIKSGLGANLRGLAGTLVKLSSGWNIDLDPEGTFNVNQYDKEISFQISWDETKADPHTINCIKILLADEFNIHGPRKEEDK